MARVARGEYGAKGEVGKRKEAEGINARLHKCTIPSPAVLYVVQKLLWKHFKNLIK